MYKEIVSELTDLFPTLLLIKCNRKDSLLFATNYTLPDCVKQAGNFHAVGECSKRTNIQDFESNYPISQVRLYSVMNRIIGYIC